MKYIVVGVLVMLMTRQMGRCYLLGACTVEACFQGDQIACQQKILANIAIQPGQGGGEWFEVLVSRVVNSSDGQVGQLETPFKIYYQYGSSRLFYPLRYVSTVNDQPFEEVSVQGFLDAGCNAENQPGFCCRCQLSQLFDPLSETSAVRGGLFCGEFGSRTSSLHLIRYFFLKLSFFSLLILTLVHPFLLAPTQCGGMFLQ